MNIPVEIHASLPQNINMRKMDLCALLSNLFDNALEASQNLAEPKIQIEIKPVKNYLYFFFSNKMQQDGDSEQTSFETSKADKEMHGFGLGIIEEISRRYDGIVDIKTDNGCFKIKVMIQHV